MPLLSEVPGKDRREVGVALGGIHGERVADRPEDEAGDPLLEAEAKGRSVAASGAIDASRSTRSPGRASTFAESARPYPRTHTR